MRTKSQTASAGKTKVTGVGVGVLKGAGTARVRGGAERKGTETYDHRSLKFRKLNNADPGSKI